MLGVFYSYRRYFAAIAPAFAASVSVEAGSATAGAHV